MKQSSIIIIIGILLIAGVVWVWQKDTETDGITPTPPTPVEPTEPVEPTPPQEPDSVQVPEGWKTYRNTELGFELAYPGEWFLYDRETFVKDNGGENFNPDTCGATGGVGLKDAIILSKENLGTCADLGYSGPLISDFALRASPLLSQDPINRYKNKPGETIITIDRTKALKTTYLGDDMTTIEFNYKEKSYVIFLRKSKRDGFYDPILDNILTTFRFLD